MEYYKITMEVIKYYKKRACEVIGNNCEKCQAAYEHSGKLWCVFDTVNEFINWDNVYNK